MNKRGSWRAQLMFSLISELICSSTMLKEGRPWLAALNKRVISWRHALFGIHELDSQSWVELSTFHHSFRQFDPQRLWICLFS
jgi:hypothetical protein